MPTIAALDDRTAVDLRAFVASDAPAGVVRTDLGGPDAGSIHHLPGGRTLLVVDHGMPADEVARLWRIAGVLDELRTPEHA